MSSLTNIPTKKTNKEYGIQSYRTDDPYQKQMRTATEWARDVADPIPNPESEMARPYLEQDYKNLEYNMLPPAGETSGGWDLDWAQPPDSDAFQNSFTDMDNMLYDVNGKRFYPKGFDGLRVKE